MSKNGRKPRSSKPRNVSERAYARGITPLKRYLSPESYTLFEKANVVLGDKLGGGVGRSYDIDSLTVSLVSTNRLLAPGMANDVPPTKKILEHFSSWQEPIDGVLISELGLWGDSYPKLGFRLVSAKLVKEFGAIASAYGAELFDLTPNYLDPLKSFKPHCTIATLDMLAPPHLKNAEALAEFNETAGLMGQAISLLPINPDNFRRR